MCVSLFSLLSALMISPCCILIHMEFTVHRSLITWSLASGCEGRRYVSSNRTPWQAFIWQHSAKSSKLPSASTGMTRRTENRCLPHVQGRALETEEGRPSPPPPGLSTMLCSPWLQITLSISNPCWAALREGSGKSILYILRMLSKDSHMHISNTLLIWKTTNESGFAKDALRPRHAVPASRPCRASLKDLDDPKYTCSVHFKQGRTIYFETPCSLATLHHKAS